MGKRLAIYTQDGRNPANTADHQMDWILELSTDENIGIARAHVDYKNLSLYRMLGEGTQTTHTRRRTRCCSTPAPESTLDNRVLQGAH